MASLRLRLGRPRYESGRTDIARIDKRLAVVSFAVLTLGPAVVAMLVKLTFFP